MSDYGFRFTKPANKRYVDMCIEFDREFYEPNRDDEKLFGYMFLLFKMLAYKSNYFKNASDYNEYAMFAATTIYLRYMRKWQNGERVKSVLNYIKTVKGPLKVTYQNENFAQVFDPEKDNKTDGEKMEEYNRAFIQGQYDSGMREEIMSSIEAMPRLISEAAGESPFASDPKVKKDLEISCMLTMLDRTTIPTKAMESLKARNADDAAMAKALAKEAKNPPTLWKLRRGMEAEVEVVLNKAKAAASEEINDIRGRYTLPDDVLESIMANTYKDACMMDEKED